jgi:hypothetical protein
MRKICKISPVVALLCFGLNTHAALPEPTPFPLSGTPHDHEVDTAHDHAGNDPSRGTRFRLKKPLNQERLVLTGTNGNIEKNIESAFRSMKSEYRRMKSARERISDPAYTRYLRIHQGMYQPEAENGLTLVNADHEFEGISDRKFGYCWGFATLFRNLTQLAFFDPSQPRVPDVEFYLRKIDRIVAGHATVIPGYRNLRELSLEPRIELYLKLNTMELWRNRAVRSTSLNIFKNSTEAMSFEEVESLLRNLEVRLQRGEFPKVLFSALIPTGKILGMSTDIHVVLVNRVERLSGNRAKIHLWDINFYAETLKKSPKIIEVTSKHGLVYEPWYEPDKPYAEASALVSRIEFAPEENIEVSRNLKSLKAFCEASMTRHHCQP